MSVAHKFKNFEDAMSCARVLIAPVKPPTPEYAKQLTKPLCRVVGGTVKYKPIDKTAALVVSRAPEWARPPMPDPTFAERPQDCGTRPKKTHNTKPKRKKNHMSKAGIGITESVDRSRNGMDNGSYVSEFGIRVTKIGGQTYMNYDDVNALIVRQIHELPRQTNPQVKAAEDARKIISELVAGLGGEMEKFEAQAKLHVEQIRGKRMTIVAEAAQMTNALKEIRQFFLGSDYKDEVARLSEFVDLCERLNRLKESGFLDQIADTMLTLAVNRQ
jgi:hypothetical protein